MLSFRTLDNTRGSKYQGSGDKYIEKEAEYNGKKILIYYASLELIRLD